MLTGYVRQTGEFDAEILRSSDFQLISVTLDASAIGLTAGQPLGLRIRRIAATGTEIAGEFAIQGAVLIWTCNKLGEST